MSFQESATHVLLAKSGEITMLGSSVSASTLNDVVIARYSDSGGLLWSRRLDSPEHGIDTPIAAQSAPDGGLWFTVLHNGVGGTRAELVRFDALGNTIWTHELSVTGEDGVDAAILNPIVAVDLDHGPARVYFAVGDAGGIRVQRLDDTGAIQWNAFWESTHLLGDIPKQIVVDQGGIVYIAGRAGFIREYATIAFDSNGTLLFEEHESGVGNTVLTDPLLEAHPDGGVVVSGSPETTCGAFEVRTWRLTPSGERLWNVVVPDGPCGNSFGPTALAVADDGRIAVTSELIIPIGWRTFLYNDAGEELWTAEWTNAHSSSDAPRAIAFDPSGGIVVTGTRQPVPTNDGFGIARYTPAGVRDWEWESANPESGSGIALTFSPVGTIAVGATSFGGMGIGARAVTMKFIPPRACLGDITGAAGFPDGHVDVEDLNAILMVWDTTVALGDPRDLANDDGIIDIDDLNVILSVWNGCP